jgi:hypothetical protein
MVTSRQAPNSPNSPTSVRPKKRSMGGVGLKFLLLILTIGVLGLGGIGIFAPARLAVFHERTLGLLHGGITDTQEQTYVDGCVYVADQGGPRAITRTQRTVIFGDGTTLQVVFSGAPAETNACP